MNEKNIQKLLKKLGLDVIDSKYLLPVEDHIMFLQEQIKAQRGQIVRFLSEAKTYAYYISQKDQVAQEFGEKKLRELEGAVKSAKLALEGLLKQYEDLTGSPA